MRSLLLAFVLIALTISDAFGELSLTTTFVSNNSLNSQDTNGTLFLDIENVSPLDINIISWDINIGCGPGTTVEVYYREGPIEGFTNTLDGWMLLGSINNLNCLGQDNRTPLPIGGLIIEPGQIKGFAMVEINPDNSGTWYYTNATGSNEVYNNGDIELITNTVSSNFPGLPLFMSMRVWNGTVYYERIPPPRNVPTLSEWGLITMASLLGIVGLMVLRRKKLHEVGSV